MPAAEINAIASESITFVDIQTPLASIPYHTPNSRNEGTQKRGESGDKPNWHESTLQHLADLYERVRPSRGQHNTPRF
jgi:hypothetical protein